jgi:hypothetical protein
MQHPLKFIELALAEPMAIKLAKESELENA